MILSALTCLWVTASCTPAPRVDPVGEWTVSFNYDNYAPCEGWLTITRDKDGSLSAEIGVCHPKWFVMPSPPMSVDDVELSSNELRLGYDNGEPTLTGAIDGDIYVGTFGWLTFEAWRGKRPRPLPSSRTRGRLRDPATAAR